MAGIAENIERYNSAYRLAWKHISELQKQVFPNIALRLDVSIRRQLAAGAKDPLLIASEALSDFQIETLVTLKRDARTQRKPETQTAKINAGYVFDTHNPASRYGIYSIAGK